MRTIALAAVGLSTASVVAQDLTAIHVDAALADERAWSSRIVVEEGERVVIRVRITKIGTSTVLGLAGLIHQPTLSGWGADDALLPFSDEATDGGPNGYGRVSPFATSGMGSQSVSGRLTSHVDPGGILRFAGANATTMTTNLQWGIGSGQLPRANNPTEFAPFPPDAIVFKYAVIFGPTASQREHVATVPFAGVAGARATWYRTIFGTGNLFSSVTSDNIHPATIEVIGPDRPCPSAPAFRRQPEAITLRAGRPATLSATVIFGVAGQCAPMAQWFRAGQAIADDDRVSGSATTTLTIRGTRVTDSGEYQLVVSNSNGSAASDPVPLGVYCPADLDDGTMVGMPDGGVTIDDLLFFLDVFAAGSLRADLDDGSGTGTPDGGVTIDDLLYFLDRFASGC